MNRFFHEINRNFGFGCMRLPKCGEEVDHALFSRMIDRFLDAGFNYFDTARGYHSGASETALRECLVKRYPRDRFILTDKLSGPFFETEAEIRPLFESQLLSCGVSYFDFYLLHAQSRRNYEKYKECRAYEIVSELKKEGKIRHIGISFHDTADYLEKILSEQPEIEVVQLQFNYFDYEDEQVQSRKCYEVCCRFGKPVIVMEPVRGGSLVYLPEKAKEIFRKVGDGSPASFAIRFAASFDNVALVLSGMSDLAQAEDNIGFMRDFQPLSEAEREAVKKVSDLFHSVELVGCTGCRYCTDGCPRHIPIPDLISCYNRTIQFEGWDGKKRYGRITSETGKASDCVSCGKCEQICPQKLPIRSTLKKISAVFEE